MSDHTDPGLRTREEELTGGVLTAKEAWRRMLEASQAWLDAHTLESAEAMEAARRDLIEALQVWERR